MNLLTSTPAIRFALFAGIFLVSICILGGLLAIVKLRKSISGESELGSPGRPLLSPDTLAFATFQQTIKELKQQQQELQATAKAETARAKAASSFFRTLLDQVPVPAVLLNNVGIVQQANSSARQFFGYASLSGFGLKDLISCFSSGNDETFAEQVRTALRGSAPIDFSAHYTSRNAASVFVRISVIPNGTGDAALLFSGGTNEGACTPEVLPPVETMYSAGTEQG